MNVESNKIPEAPQYAGDEWRGLVSMALVAEQGSTAGQHNLAYALQTSKTFMLPERCGRTAVSHPKPSRRAHRSSFPLHGIISS